MNDDTRDLFSRQDSDKEDLLSELDSLKELLDEPALPVATTRATTAEGSPLLPPSHITTVEEYFRWKAELEGKAQPVAEATPDEEAAEDDIPTLTEAVEFDEWAVTPANTAAEPPLLEEVVAQDEFAHGTAGEEFDEGDIPLLDEVVDAEDVVVLLDEVSPGGNETSPAVMSRSEIDELVGLIVERKLQRLKPELEREVLEELQRILPPDLLS